MVRLALAGLSVLMLCGCDQSMREQKRMGPQARSALWSDGTASRPIPAGTVARGDLAYADAERTPPPVTAALVARGQERYTIFCAPCHGATGDGDGMIVQRGFPRPVSIADTRQRGLSADHIADVIAHGYGVMYPFARLDPADRWAIVAYVRALQMADPDHPTNTRQP